MGDYIIYSEELSHSGVKGMRWGIRRYQNKDGSLTPLGKRRAAKLESKYEKTTGKKIGSSESSESKPPVTKTKTSKNPKKMTAEELKKQIERKKLEKEYRDLNRDSQTRSKKFVTDVLESIGKQSLTNMGTQAVNSGLTHLMNKMLKGSINSNKKIDKDAAEALIKELKFYTNNEKKKK